MATPSAMWSSAACPSACTALTASPRTSTSASRAGAATSHASPMRSSLPTRTSGVWTKPRRARGSRTGVRRGVQRSTGRRRRGARRTPPAACPMVRSHVERVLVARALHRAPPVPVCARSLAAGRRGPEGVRAWGCRASLQSRLIKACALAACQMSLVVKHLAKLTTSAPSRSPMGFHPLLRRVDLLLPFRRNSSLFAPRRVMLPFLGNILFA